MESSFVTIRADRVRAICDLAIEQIDRLRATRWRARIERYRKKHARWRWLPWWRELTDEEIRERILENDPLAGLEKYHVRDIARHLANATHYSSDGTVQVAVTDLEALVLS